MYLKPNIMTYTKLSLKNVQLKLVKIFREYFAGIYANDVDMLKPIKR